MNRLLTAAVLVALGLTVRTGLPRSGKEAPLSFRVAWATFLGGSEREQPREIIPLPDGSALVGGQTFSADLPFTPGVAQPTYAGEPAGSGHPGMVGGECFLAQVGPRGEGFGFVTCFGGSKQERAVYGMALDGAGSIVIVSATRSPDLPTTEEAVQRSDGGGKSDTLLAKLSPDATRSLWCTYLGSAREDWPRGGLALDAEDDVLVFGGGSSPDFAAARLGGGGRGRRPGKRHARQGRGGRVEAPLRGAVRGQRRGHAPGRMGRAGRGDLRRRAHEVPQPARDHRRRAAVARRGFGLLARVPGPGRR